MAKLPENAFEIYTSLPANDRSYSAVAKRFGVAKRTVTERARREGWQKRLSEIDRRAREQVEEGLVDSRHDAIERQLKVTRLVQSRALKTLQATPEFRNPGDALRALNFALRAERDLLGHNPKQSTDGGSQGKRDGEPIDESERSNLLRRLQRSYPPSERFLFESPVFLLELMLRADTAPTTSPPETLRMVECIDTLRVWLDGLAEHDFIDDRRPFHLQLLFALSGDPDEARRASMRETLSALVELLEARRVRRGIPLGPHLDWELLHILDRETEQRLSGVAPTWAQVFGGGEEPHAFLWVWNKLESREEIDALSADCAQVGRVRE